MDIQELLGTDYKEGMSDTEILDVLKTKKLADLSSGKYVNKDMATAKENQLNDQLRDLQSQLDSKLTDDEKRQKDLDSKDKEIAKLKETIKQSTLATNKAQLMANVVDTLDKLEVKNDFKSPSVDYNVGGNFGYYSSTNMYNNVGYFNKEYYRFGVVFIY